MSDTKTKTAESPADFKLTVGEKAVRQMIEMALDLFTKHPEMRSEIPSLVVEATKEMIRRGNIKSGTIVSNSEK